MHQSIETSSSLMVLTYQWLLENVEEDPKMLSSEMILFRGEKVFRVALKNTVQQQTLIFMAINFNKMGMKVQKVFYSNQNFENSIIPLVELKSANDPLQMFSVPVSPMVFEKTSFNFYLQIEGSDSNFSYQLVDRLLKNELWMAVKKSQWTDIDLIVQDKKISAHKCILGARSPVFASEFAKDGKLNQIIMDDVDFSSAEQFLRFLYTGETNKSFSNEQLFKLANRYQLTTLNMLCKNALRQIYAEELTRSLISLHPNNNPVPTFEISPMKDTELYFDTQTSTFLASWNFSYEKASRVEPVFFGSKFEENSFSAHVAVRSVCGGELRLIWAKHRNNGYQVVEAFCFLEENGIPISQWKKMERRNVQEKGLIEIFSITPPDVHANISYTITFRIKIASNVENYHYEMMDSTFATPLWTAATNGMLTDVEIFVGNQKFETHRVVLAARSPVFDLQLKENKTIAKSSITIGSATIDPNIFRHFLKFLYTGTLEISACDKELLSLAETYEVKTLKKLCQTAIKELEVEEVTTSILAANCF